MISGSTIGQGQMVLWFHDDNDTLNLKSIDTFDIL